MKFVRITDQHAAELVSWLVDDDVCAAEREEAMADERAEIDRLLEQVDGELDAQAVAERARLSLDRRDAHPTRRTRRRNARRMVRSLPDRLPAPGESGSGGEAA